MKKIFVIHTGGTISMQEDSQSGVVKPSDSHPLTEQMLSFENAYVEVKELFHLPSPHITPKEMLKVKEVIEEAYHSKTMDGIVVTHGTDTLEETAYFLDLTLNIPIPVVVTGAMRSSNELGSDGLYNLLSAIKVASCEEAKHVGVLVVMNDEIHTAKNVTKTHTSNVATFQSPQYGPIGIVNKRIVSFHHKPIERQTFPIQKITKHVVLLKAYAGMDERILTALEAVHPDGIVIEALGQGNLPPTLIPSIKRFIQNNVPIVIVSRCFNGIVQDVYGYEGGGSHLKSLGVIFSNGLNGQKARMKLLIALEHTNRLSELEEIFAK
ncbi:asparaginase [Bacillus alveayuensis]|jgi:L-asparaginase|uniref:asparaginase n=1 Tax=Aeribacillus alveayuensis TaxID=279215 RepID=A0ABT9VKM5_9BACI|nr:asparaginase [Bacillus alveayuensis]MDQ0161508.1 L-asparaginase [Bacillus alveayuensis]